MNHQHQFASPLGRDLFAMFAPIQTEHARATQQELAEVLEGEPMPRLTEAEVNHLATLHAENRSEGRTIRPFRQSPHGE